MKKEFHNHLPDKISEHVQIIESMWNNLMADITNVVSKAQLAYSTFSEVAQRLETIIDKHSFKQLKPILKDFTQLLSLSRFARNKYYGKVDEDKDEDEKEEEEEDEEVESVRHHVVKLKLLELFDLENVRRNVGETLNSLRYLSYLDEKLFYNSYKEAVATCSTEGEAFDGLTDVSYRLLSRLKFLSFEEQISSLQGKQEETDAKLRQLFALVTSGKTL